MPAAPSRTESPPVTSGGRPEAAPPCCPAVSTVSCRHRACPVGHQWCGSTSQPESAAPTKENILVFFTNSRQIQIRITQYSF